MGKTKEVRDAVEAELDFDPRVDATDVTVRNLGGEVALDGTVSSYPQYLAARAAAQRVSGVTKVLNHLEVVLPERDYRDDAQLTTTSNNALGQNVSVPAGIEATANDGNVQLTGTVRFRTDRDAAERAVAGLTGVRNVWDYIEVDDDLDPTDATFLVLEAMDRYGLTHQNSDVSVTTSGTTVTLAGHVRTWAEHDAVIDAAWMAGGVSDVDDQLAVTG